MLHAYTPPRKPLSLYPLVRNCLLCGRNMYSANSKPRVVRMRRGDRVLKRYYYTCRNEQCENFGKMYRPELEGRFAFPCSPYGLDVIASASEIYQAQRTQTGVQSKLASNVNFSTKLSRRVVPRILSLAEQLFPPESVTVQAFRQIAQAKIRFLDMFLLPTYGYATLTIVRDCVSGTYLLSRKLSAVEDRSAIEQAAKVLYMQIADRLHGSYVLLYDPKLAIDDISFGERVFRCVPRPCSPSYSQSKIVQLGLFRELHRIY